MKEDTQRFIFMALLFVMLGIAGYSIQSQAREIPCWMFGPDAWTIEKIQCRTHNGTPRDLLKTRRGRSPVDSETGKQLRGSDLPILKIEEREEDDLERPIHRPPQSSPVFIDCADADDCQSQVVTCATQRPDPVPDGWTCDRDINTCPQGEGAPKWDDKANWEDIDGEDWFIWCQKVIGHEQKRVPHYVVDLDEKKRLADEAEEKEKAEKEKRARQEAGRDKRLNRIQQCVTLPANATSGQMINCIQKLSKDRMIDNNRQPEDEEPVE